MVKFKCFTIKYLKIIFFKKCLFICLLNLIKCERVIFFKCFSCISNKIILFYIIF